MCMHGNANDAKYKYRYKHKYRYRYKDRYKDKYKNNININYKYMKALKGFGWIDIFFIFSFWG